MNDSKPTYEELEYTVRLLANEAKWSKQAQQALKEREEMLRVSEEKYRLIFENVFDVILIFDREFKILDISPSIERTLGYKPKEFIGKPFTDLNILTPESLGSAISRATRVLSGESMAPAVFEFVAKDGTKKIGELTANPLIRKGKVEAVICVARDVTNKMLAK
ncbi:PAS domain S-box protein [Thermodesulfobacteriota bacterium]